MSRRACRHEGTPGVGIKTPNERETAFEGRRVVRSIAAVCGVLFSVLAGTTNTYPHHSYYYQ